MSGKKRLMTIKDIALQTGLSKGTVDRVLHNRGEVSKQSYEKVMRYIEESGYTPNVHASLLASGQSHRIAALLPNHEPGSFWELFQNGLDKAEENLHGLGLSILRFGYDQYDIDSFRAACDELLASAPDGVVTAPLFLNDTTVLARRLQEAGIPYVYIDSKLEDDGYMAYFGTARYQSGYLCGYLLADDRRKATKIREVVSDGRIESGYYILPPLSETQQRYILYTQKPDKSGAVIYIEGTLSPDDIMQLCYQKKK